MRVLVALAFVCLVVLAVDGRPGMGQLEEKNLDMKVEKGDSFYLEDKEEDLRKKEVQLEEKNLDMKVEKGDSFYLEDKEEDLVLAEKDYKTLGKI